MVGRRRRFFYASEHNHLLFLGGGTRPSFPFKAPENKDMQNFSNCGEFPYICTFFIFAQGEEDFKFAPLPYGKSSNKPLKSGLFNACYFFKKLICVFCPCCGRCHKKRSRTDQGFPNSLSYFLFFSLFFSLFRSCVREGKGRANFSSSFSAGTCVGNEKRKRQKEKNY